MVYTCERQMCRVGCSCKICRNKKPDCRRRCREFPCQDCTDQCKIHSLKLDRSFEFKKHEFTLKSNGRDTVKFAIIHAGIFKDCVQCQDDLTDHRNLHRIIHMRCKFCKQIQLPFASEKILTLHELQLRTRTWRHRESLCRLWKDREGGRDRGPEWWACLSISHRQTIGREGPPSSSRPVATQHIFIEEMCQLELSVFLMLCK